MSPSARGDPSAEAAGMVTTTLVYVIGAALGCVAAVVRDGMPAVAVRCVAVAHAIGVVFFGPTILRTSVTLMRFPGASNGSVTVGFIAGTTVLAVTAVTGRVCWRHEPSKGDDAAGPPAWIDRLRREVLASFYEGSRAEQVWYVRMHVFEDIAAAYAIAVLSGSYPATQGGCTAVCFALLAVAVAHLVYVTAVRPYKESLEQWLAVVNAGIEGTIAGCAVWTRLSNDTHGSGPSTVALGYCLLTANAFYFVQLMALACGPLIRRHAQGRNAVSEEVVAPLLMLPTSVALAATLANRTRPSTENK